MSKMLSTERYAEHAGSGPTKAPIETGIGFHRELEEDAFTSEGAPPPAARAPHPITPVRNSP